MKTLFLVLISLLFFNSTHAQNQVWGWGLPITITVNGSTLNCTVTDPTLGSQSYTVNDVYIHSNRDGVLSWITNTGIAGGLTYDVNLGTWKTKNFYSSSSINTICADRLISFVSTDGTVGAATYDPNLGIWKDTILETAPTINNFEEIRGGILTYKKGQTLCGAVYDPALQVWTFTQLSTVSGSSQITSKSGIITFTDSLGIHAATYDPGVHNWRLSIIDSSTSVTTLLNDNGVIGYLTSSGRVGGAVYHPDLQSWEYSTILTSPSNNNLSIINGTLFWNNPLTGSKQFGYNINTNSFQSGYATDLYCKMYFEKANNHAPYLVYFWNMSIGTNAFSQNADDGHTFTRRWGFKQYANTGYYNPTLTIYHSLDNHTCSSNLTVPVTKITSQKNNYDVNVYPNPTNRKGLVHIESNKRIGTFRLINILGTTIIQQEISSSSADISLSNLALNAGTYFIEITSAKDNQITRRKIILE